jgi:beta-lactam-binding protein with PASTA domain
VMQQEPVSGNIVQAGATVTIWIAVPSDRVLVPNLLGMSQAAAEIQLTGRGLVAQVELVDSEMTGGTVVGQDPEAGTEVEAGATVIVRVSNAPVVQVVQVPLVGGMGYTLDQAQSILALYHLNTSIEYEERVDFLPGIVIRQHPAAGVVVPAGSYVHLIVAKEPTTTTEPPTTTTTTLPEETTTTLSPETTTTTITPTTTPTL